MPQLSPRRSYQLYVGIDIAAASFEAAFQTPDGVPTALGSFQQTPADFSRFHKQLQALGIAPADTLVVLEATGSYWVALSVSLHEAGYCVSVVNPAKVHAWAKSLSRRSKTDKLDAKMLAQFAAERRPELWTPPPEVYHELRQRLIARDGLLEMRQQARNQLHALMQWPVVIASVQQHLEGVISMLDGEIKTLDAEVASVVEESAWAASAKHLQSIPGMGLVTSTWILVATVHFTVCPSAEAAVGYAGLNPLDGESGTSVRRRAKLGGGGHGRLRKALYMATLSATRYNPSLKIFYTRLKEAGKPEKVARCAAARKLLHLAFAVVTKQQDFDPSYQKLPSRILPEMEIAP